MKKIYDIIISLIFSATRHGLEALERKLEGSDFWTPIEVNKKLIQVYLEIPKFRIESTIDQLKEALESLGMTAMFQPSMTGLKGISDEGLYVSKVIQKAFIEVDETGTEAAAASAVVISTWKSAKRPKVERFIVNHPFLFFVRDLQTNLVLFQGRVTLPTTIRRN